MTIIQQKKLLKVFDDIKADMKVNKKLSRIVTELLLKGRKLSTTLVFFSQSYFKVQKNIHNTLFYHENTKKDTPINSIK